MAMEDYTSDTDHTNLMRIDFHYSIRSSRKGICSFPIGYNSCSLRFFLPMLY